VAPNAFDAGGIAHFAEGRTVSNKAVLRWLDDFIAAADRVEIISIRHDARGD
jgi:hypothetical protein